MTQIQSNIFKGLSLIDENFDIKQIPNYTLMVQFGINDIRCCVFDITKNRIIALENYTFQTIYNFELFCDSLHSLMYSDNLISKFYNSKNTIISWIGNKYTFVPDAFFEKDNKEDYLKLNHTLESDEVILVDDVFSMEAKIIFSIPSSIHNTIQSIFSNSTIHHHSNTLIQRILGKYKNEIEKSFFVHVQVNQIEIIVTEGKKLIFFNTFNYQTTEDFIYYVLFVAEQMNLNPEKMNLILLGEIEKDSSIYWMLFKYIKKISFEERNDNMEYSYKLDVFPPHFYFNLFNQSLLANH